jgi:hypothetical protein
MARHRTDSTGFRRQFDLMGWMPPPAGPDAAFEPQAGAIEEEPISDVHVLATDLAKRSFQVYATDRGGAVLFNRSVWRARLMQFLNWRAPCMVAMEAVRPATTGSAPPNG